MIRNIAVMAHVDTGKTTLTEQMLRHCGAIRMVGSVDEGTAHTDRLEVERRRGISVHAACVPMRWRDTEINLIDTPGHTDFSAEVERSLWALDGAVLLISAVDGVLPQTEKLFQTLRKLRLPVVIFLNKTDREGADVDAVLRQARERLHAGVTACTPEALMERIAEQDEAALEDYLNGTLWPSARLLPAAAAMTRSGELIPALAGSALKDQGVEALLDALVDFLPPPEGDPDGPLCGVVFGVEMDKTMGRAALTRMFSGRLCNRDMIGDSKVTQIRMLTVEGRPKDAGELRAGEIGVIYGLSNVRAGDVLGDPALLPRRLPRGELCDPLMMVKVLCDPARKVELRAALEQLSVEDGHFTHEELEGVEHIRVMGLIQLEVLQELLATRFGLAVTFDKPTVVYRETIAKEAVGFYAYTMPKPCWAVLKFLITPLPRGSGVQYESVTPVREIMERYQHQVEQAIPLATRQGMLGWQVDDVKITLIGGEHHLVHTHPLDFIVCTPIAFMDGLRRGGSVLLEPMMRLHITAPEGYLGRLLSEVAAMGGEMEDSQLRQGMCDVTARAPLTGCMDFSQRLAALTSGGGAVSMELSGYRECPFDESKRCPRKSVHPLDTSKYILAARSALEGGIFDR